jgi:hypothetical protein
MTSKIQLLGHGGFPTELTATSLAHWQVVHIPLFLVSTKCVQFPCVQSLKSPFQISVSCELQKCIFDSVQNKPALPLLLNAKAYFDIFNLYIYWYQVLLRPCPFRLDYPTPQISYKSLTRQDYSVTWALWHVQTVSPSHKTFAISPHPQELPSCSLVMYNWSVISQGTLLYSNPPVQIIYHTRVLGACSLVYERVALFLRTEPGVSSHKILQQSLFLICPHRRLESPTNTD